jgi:thioesterase domain-containing protein
VLIETQDEVPQHPRPPTLGWEGFSKHIERRRIAGTHFSMLRTPHVTTLARVLNELLSPRRT